MTELKLKQYMQHLQNLKDQNIKIEPIIFHNE